MSRCFVAPADVVVDQVGPGVVVGVVGAVEAAVAPAFELGLDPLEPAGVLGSVGELAVVGVGPGAHPLASVNGKLSRINAIRRCAG